MLDGNLGEWDTDPVSMDLKPGSKPFNNKYYTVPRISKETFCKELKQLVEIGVLTPVQQIKYGTPIFIIPKKEGTARFIKDYHRLNQQWARNLNPLPRIGETMQKLEGFHYMTA